MGNTRPLLISFAAFILTLAGMLWSEQQAGCGTIIIPLELVPDIATFKRMILGCNVDWLKRNTLLDFVFLVTYSSTLYYGLKSLSARLAPYAWLTLLPAAFDCVENVLLIKFLYADVADVSPTAFSTYYFCVHIKFVLLVIILITLLVLALKLLFGKLAK